jgi:hypothetical protein
MPTQRKTMVVGLIGIGGLKKRDRGEGLGIEPDAGRLTTSPAGRQGLRRTSSPSQPQRQDLLVRCWPGGQPRHAQARPRGAG